MSGAQRRVLRIGLWAAAVLAVLYGLLALANARTVQSFGTIIARVETDRPLVALTFDDGPTAADTPALLDALGDTPATFFLIGRDMRAHPDETMAIAEAGHEIGNHSDTHRRMVLVSPDWVREELARTDAAIAAAGYDGPTHFRPPYGKKLIALPWVLAEQQRTTIMWSVESDGTLSPEAMAAQVLAETGPGDIVLLHGMYAANAATRTALPLILAGLEERGLTPVTVSELMAAAPDR